MKIAVEVAAVESAARQLGDAVSVAHRIGVAPRLGLVETALPGWVAARAASEAGEHWGRVESALALALGDQAQTLLAAAHGYRASEVATMLAFGAGR